MSINISTTKDPSQFVIDSCRHSAIIPISIIILLIPNIIAWIVSTLKKVKMPSKMIWISLIQNILFALMVSCSICFGYNKQYIAGVLLCAFFLFIIGIMLSLGVFSIGIHCNCCGPFTPIQQHLRLFNLIGYTYPFSVWWRSQTDVIVFRSKKKMSATDNLKAKAGERLLVNNNSCSDSVERKTLNEHML